LKWKVPLECEEKSFLRIGEKKLYGSTLDGRLIQQTVQSLPSFFSSRQCHRTQNWRC